MEKDDTNLIPSFGQSMYDSISDSIMDTADYGLDQIAENLLSDNLEAYIPVVQDLPIIKYFVSAGKLVKTVRDRLFLKKTLEFIASFKAGTVNKGEIDRRRRALADGEKWIRDELEILIATIEQIDRSAKAKILAEVYRSYINKEINKGMFDDFCSITERLFLSDIVQLHVEYDYENQIEENKQRGNKYYMVTTARYPEITGRLLALGLMRASVKLSDGTSNTTDILNYDISYRGKLYSKILSRIDFLGIGTKPSNI